MSWNYSCGKDQSVAIKSSVPTRMTTRRNILPSVNAVTELSAGLLAASSPASYIPRSFSDEPDPSKGVDIEQTLRPNVVNENGAYRKTQRQHGHFSSGEVVISSVKIVSTTVTQFMQNSGNHVDLARRVVLWLRAYSCNCRC